jgi:hypothetical protein
VLPASGQAPRKRGAAEERLHPCRAHGPKPEGGVQELVHALGNMGYEGEFWHQYPVNMEGHNGASRSSSGKFDKGDAYSLHVDLVLKKDNGSLLGIEVQGTSHEGGRTIQKAMDSRKKDPTVDAGLDYVEVRVKDARNDEQWVEEAAKVVAMLKTDVKHTDTHALQLTLSSTQVSTGSTAHVGTHQEELSIERLVPFCSPELLEGIKGTLAFPVVVVVLLDLGQMGRVNLGEPVLEASPHLAVFALTIPTTPCAVVWEENVCPILGMHTDVHQDARSGPHTLVLQLEAGHTLGVACLPQDC